MVIHNEIGCGNRWGRFAFRVRSYRAMHHWIADLKKAEVWGGYHEHREFDKFLNAAYK